jgi:hypothetical protein
LTEKAKKAERTERSHDKKQNGIFQKQEESLEETQTATRNGKMN